MTKIKRPLTVREMQNKKEINSGRVRLLNTSKQLIKIHLRAPEGSDFFLAAQDVSLNPGQSYLFKKDRLWLEQVDRLTKQGKIQKMFDSERDQPKN
jgi:hypothetical protein